MSPKKLLVTAAIVVGGLALGASPALAGHDHFIRTPSHCFQVAFGQTAISDTGHGGYHRFHENVHLGATESSGWPNHLGDGNAQVEVFKDSCP